uniref:Small ribosomal subunit protein uS3c n=1 Tax=Mesotaenium endlicherianum TaxID=184485 RepID=A0A024B4B9_9VIRI|nr:ribosomal protein S3 [Mesotaenium endlicherianum]AHZ11207.1 ribosomal protein S3 [Mesotaenium endlicherianum]
MGQKTHPLGFRLALTQSHHAIWFAPSNLYSEQLQIDERMRNCIKEYIRKYVRSAFSNGGITRVEIQRKTDLIHVVIYTGFPALLVENENRDIEPLRRELQVALGPVNDQLRVSLAQIDNPYAEAAILAAYIASQLEDRVPFRRAMKEIIQLASKKGGVKGIKVQIAGRLNGAEIARVEWAREGRVPLQTLRAHIDYSHCPAQTIYGVLGIKVWTFQESSS